MSKSLKQIDSLIDELDKIDNDEDLEEASTTQADPGYMTPKAFSKKSPPDEIKRKKRAEKMGYKLANENKSLFKQMIGLNEVNYKEYKNDNTISNKKKVNLAIKEINRKLFEIERVIKRNIKLKQEVSIDNSHFWKSSRAKLRRISERILIAARCFNSLKA